MWRGLFGGLRAVPLLAVLAASQASPRAEEAAGVIPGVTAGPNEAPIRLDGRLDEPAWQSAGRIPDLTQQDPRPGEPTPYRTEVRVLADGDTLYFGVECSDPAADRIAIHTLQRDSSMNSDDTITFVLDTFGDRRTGYLFKVNAAAARFDGLISGPDEFSEDWDGIWDARTHRTATGWTLEVAVPTRTLRFTPGLDQWGFNLERHIARDRLVLRWAGTTLDSSLEDLSRAGTIAGLGSLRQGLGLSISPYGAGRYESVSATGSSTGEGDGGLDVTYDVTPSLAGVLAINPDFAETEVDTRRINLTRFSLSFPEKRGFFLEGSSLFEFATGLGTNFIPFYSRRIGLEQGEPVRIDAGAKIVGRAGRCGISALGTRVAEGEVSPQADLFAGRLTCDAGDHFRMGTVATIGDPGGVESNSLFGIDVLWHTSTFRGDKNLTASAWGARSSGDLPEGSPGGFGADIEYPNDRWDLYARTMTFGEALEPALGFLPRPGTRRHQAGGAFQPRPGEGSFGWARQLYFAFSGSRVDDLEGNTESWSLFASPFNVVTDSGEHYEIDWQRQFDHPDSDFEIAPGVVVAAGPYHFDRYGVTVEAASYRSWQAGASVWLGGYYGGRLTQISPYAGWNARSGRLQIKIKGEGDFGQLPGGDFIGRLYQLQAVLSFTPDLVLSTYTQYDSVSRTVGVNNRVRYTIRPGRDLYVVWNRNWLQHPDGGAGFERLSDQVVLKLRWTFRP